MPSDEKLDPSIVNALYYDPSYGLEDPANIAKWHVACRDDAIAKLEFQNEISSYFNLTREQTEEANERFC